MKSNHVIRALTLVCIVISIFSIDAADQDPGCSGVDMETCANAEDGGDDGTGLANEPEVTKEVECVAGTEECASPEAIASMEGSAGSDEGNPQHAAVSENPASPAGDNTASAEKPESLGAGDPNCPDRDHLMRCAGKHLDHNKNGKLDRDELQGAIDSLPWYARGILQILGSVDKMMTKCDVDGDDAISIDYDMHHNRESCLASCFKRRAFKGAFFPDCDL